MREADVILIGIGTAGEDLALRLLGAGLEVIGIDDGLVGGECPYWACIPSKMMIRAGNLVAEARRVEGAAGTVDVQPDWSPVAARVRNEATGDWDDSVAVARFGERGGHFVRGRGRLTGPDTVAVGDEEFKARRGIVIATGSRPAIPPIPGLDSVDYWTTHDAIQADPLPASLTILGGGAVGCELGQAMARFGVEITIVEGQDRLLPLEEPEASGQIESVLATEGIALVTGARVVEVMTAGEGIEVLTEDGRSVASERLLVATGRRVDLSGLGLDAAGLDPAARYGAVDDHLRAASGIWAMGDVTGKAMFTHVAMYQSAIVAADILGEDPLPAEYDALPRVTFTDPEVGSVGMTEAAARAAGFAVDTVVKSLPATFRGWLHGPAGLGMVKLVVDRSQGALLGATAVGPSGGEALGMLALAMKQRVPVSALRNMIYAFPTFYGVVGEAIGAFGRGTTTVLDPGFAPYLNG